LSLLPGPFYYGKEINGMPATKRVLQQETAGHEGKVFLGPDGIRNILPHREPFLFIQSVAVDVKNETAYAVMDMEAISPIVAGHFPGRPIVPGVIVLESVAQTAAVLGLILKDLNDESSETAQILFSDAEVKWKKPIAYDPDRQVQLQAKFVRKKSAFWFFTGQATVNNEVACEVEKLVGKEGSGTLTK